MNPSSYKMPLVLTACSPLESSIIKIHYERLLRRNVHVSPLTSGGVLSSAPEASWLKLDGLSGSSR